MITAQHRKSSHQILQVSSKCPHTDNCTITAVKYLTAESYISIPEKKKKRKEKETPANRQAVFFPPTLFPTVITLIFFHLALP